jgi:hypothetical protein
MRSFSFLVFGPVLGREGEKRLYSHSFVWSLVRDEQYGAVTRSQSIGRPSGVSGVFFAFLVALASSLPVAGVTPEGPAPALVGARLKYFLMLDASTRLQAARIASMDSTLNFSWLAGDMPRRRDMPRR